MPIIGDVQNLANKFNWEREIAITKGPGDSGYYLHSSPYDEFGNAITSVPREHYLLYHTHNEMNMASHLDMKFLVDTGQPSSVIIHRTEGPFVFTTTQTRVGMPNTGGH